MTRIDIIILCAVPIAAGIAFLILHFLERRTRHLTSFLNHTHRIGCPHCGSQLWRSVYLPEWKVNAKCFECGEFFAVRFNLEGMFAEKVEQDA